eukprot:scaffold32008_cov63-Phaeocystis_antarctica.AAC.5
MSSGSLPILVRNLGLGDKHAATRESSDPVPLPLPGVATGGLGKPGQHVQRTRWSMSCRICPRVVGASHGAKGYAKDQYGGPVAP